MTDTYGQEMRAGSLAGSGGGSSGVGGGGRGGSSDESGRFVSQVIARLNSERIGANRDFLQALQDFAAAGLSRMESEGGDAERFQRSWDQITSAVIQYADVNNINELNGQAFAGIRSRLCPGFWPFC